MQRSTEGEAVMEGGRGGGGGGGRSGGEGEGGGGESKWRRTVGSKRSSECGGGGLGSNGKGLEG